MRWFKGILAPLLERWSAFRLALVAVSIASLVWGVWLSAFPMPPRLQAIAKPMGLLSSVFGVLFGLAWRPVRPVRAGVFFFAVGWVLFALNYTIANAVLGASQVLVVFADVLQVLTFAGFFTAFALAFALCVGVITTRSQLTQPRGRVKGRG